MKTIFCHQVVGSVAQKIGKRLKITNAVLNLFRTTATYNQPSRRRNGDVPPGGGGQQSIPNGNQGSHKPIPHNSDLQPTKPSARRAKRRGINPQLSNSTQQQSSKENPALGYFASRTFAGRALKKHLCLSQHSPFNFGTQQRRV